MEEETADFSVVSSFLPVLPFEPGTVNFFGLFNLSCLIVN